jgi:pyridoxamine 5'-phosphate oxidase
MTTLQNIRREYKHSQLELDHLDRDPLIQFRFWLNEAIHSEVPEPTAMVLSTTSPGERISSRVVLLKDLDGDGFTFFTNYQSHKAVQIESHPGGSLLFFWPELERQVRIEGKIYKEPQHKSDAYFISRPEGSKIGAWASPQSRRVPSREYLENLQQDYIRLFKNRTLERPEFWGGYKLIPDLVEFWQGRENRLHDRFEYTRIGGTWEVYRLAP